MPYRLIEALTHYSASDDLFHPKYGIYLNEQAFYALAKLAGREISPTPQAFAIEEFTKAMLLLKQREKQAEKPFTARYFFIDLKYQNYFINGYLKQFTENEYQLVHQTAKQLQNIYNWSDEDFAQVTSQNDTGIELRSTDPVIMNQLLSLSLPQKDERDLLSLLRGDYNIHLIVTNKTNINRHISNDLIREIDNTFAIVELQDKYSFNGRDWINSPNLLVPEEDVSHLRGVELNELSFPDDEYTQEHIYRNFINLSTANMNEDIWSQIVRDMLHKNLTVHNNLDLYMGSYMDLIGDGTSKIVQSPIIVNTLDKMAMETAEIIKKQISELQKQ